MSRKIAIVFTVLILTLLSCKNNTTTYQKTFESPQEKTEKIKQPLNEAFKAYWYGGEAEITSYRLEQERYGETRLGSAVLIYVTEDFSAKAQVKANAYNATNIPVLKLNATKNFNTGLYPYTIMQSTFYPVANNQHALKVSAAVQEWCGHVYTQLNNRVTFDVVSHSYFEGEADQRFSIKKTWTENELWTKLRIHPESLPIGYISIIPSLEYAQLKHKTLKAHEATAQLDKGRYTLFYPALNRTLEINFNTEFPYNILGWTETTTQGSGSSAKPMTTKATSLSTIKSAYWTKNNTADEALRKTLQLN